MAENGAGNFVDILTNAMRQGGISQTDLAARLGVSQGAVSRWLRGKEPSPHFRAHAIETLRPLTEPAAGAPVDVSMSGPGIKVSMQVSKEIAQRMLQLMIGPNT
jgi:transcriptional regulator with XRE-family HTH domain